MGVRFGGRQKGAINKRTKEAMEKLEALGCDPLLFQALIMLGDWQGLGYESEKITKVTKDGMVVEEDRITLDHRQSAAKELLQYTYPKLKAMEVSGSIENQAELGPITKEALLNAIKKDPFITLPPESQEREVIDIQPKTEET